MLKVLTLEDTSTEFIDITYKDESVSLVKDYQTPGLQGQNLLTSQSLVRVLHSHLYTHP